MISSLSYLAEVGEPALSRLQNDENSLRGESFFLTLTSAHTLQSF